MAAESGTSIDTQSVAVSGASLLDHWNDGRARRAVASRRWTAVVLQQGPSTLPESRAELTRLSALFGEEIRRAGGRPALLMVWPLPGQQAAAVSASYRAAAEATDSVLIPAGDAWVRAAAADPGLVLTEADGFHPSPLGTELAALSVVCTLFPGSRPQPQLSLSEAQRRQLVTAACGPGGHRRLPEVGELLQQQPHHPLQLHGLERLLQERHARVQHAVVHTASSV